MWTRMSKQSPQQHRRRPTAKRRARRQAFWTAGAMLIVFLFCLPLLPKFFLQESIPTAEPVSTESSSAGSATVSQPEEAEPAPEPEPQPLVQTVRFSATGDNLIHSPIYKQAKRRAAGTEGYSFDYCYEHIAPFYVQQDVNWINQETLCTDELEPSTYPCFSTPGDCARALYRAGVRVFSLSNNHTYDKGASGIAATLRFWGSMPEDVVTTGLWKGESDYGHIPLQTVNGVTIAYLSYTEHTNGIPQNSSMQANVIYTSQTDVIEQQVKAARQLADFVVVGVHWGVENSHAIADPQRTLAQNLADWGADLIIGTHPHVTQTAQWLTGTNENKSFVAYSLGNFINAQDMPDNMIGAILDVTFQKTTAADGTVTVEIQNPVLHPVITQYEPHYANIRVYLYKDYTDELGAAHGNFALSRASIEQVLNGSIDSEFLSLE